MILYMYDESGLPMGMQYKATGSTSWTVYYYERNLQGDVIALYSSSGTKLITYTYDAYGNATVLYSSGSASTPAAKNPFRYRGYYYDLDLSMYLLGTRYYDSQICRFISPDKYVSTGQGLTGYNMFAYCGNNPVMYADYTGEFPWIIVGILAIFAVGGGVLGYNSDVKLGETLNGTPEADQSITDTELTTGDRVKNTIIGVGLGLATGGALVATGGVFVGCFGGASAAYFGVTAVQGFAIGALALDTVAFFILPIFGIEIEPIEYEPVAPPDTQPPS